MARALGVSHLFPSNWHTEKHLWLWISGFVAYLTKKRDYFLFFLVGFVIIIMMIHFCANQQICSWEFKKPLPSMAIKSSQKCIFFWQNINFYLKYHAVDFIDNSHLKMVWMFSLLTIQTNSQMFNFLAFVHWVKEQEFSPNSTSNCKLFQKICHESGEQQTGTIKIILGTARSGVKTGTV